MRLLPPSWLWSDGKCWSYRDSYSSSPMLPQSMRLCRLSKSGSFFWTEANNMVISGAWDSLGGGNKGQMKSYHLLFKWFYLNRSIQIYSIHKDRFIFSNTSTYLQSYTFKNFKPSNNSVS